MKWQEDNDLEQDLQAAFEPDADTVERVVAAAMRPRSSQSMGLRLAATVALVLIAIVVLTWWFRPAPVRADSVRLEYVGDVALFEFPDGSSWLISPDAASRGSLTQLNLIIVEGDRP